MSEEPVPVGLSGRTDGAVAQLGERLLCKQEVIGSIPFSSTNSSETSGVRREEFNSLPLTPHSLPSEGCIAL